MIQVKTVFTEDSAMNRAFDGRKAKSEAKQYVTKLKEAGTAVLVAIDGSDYVAGSIWLKSL